VGVSGGADSLCLLHALRSLGYPVIAAHYEHGLRLSSREDAQRVVDLTSGMGVVCHVEHGNAAQYALQRSLSVEDAARQLRYRFLFKLAEEQQAQAVLVAHQADDQIETVLMHLLRGAGLDGLMGMSYRLAPNPWSPNIPLVRPMLDLWRPQILAYLERAGLSGLEDETNQDTSYVRNRVRLELIPYLKTFNPAAGQVLLRMARLLSDENELFRDIEDKARQRCKATRVGELVSLERAALLAEPLAIQRRLLRYCIGKLRPGLSELSFDDYERALRFIANPSLSGQTDFALGLRFTIEAGNVWITEWSAELPALDLPQLVGDMRLMLEYPGEVRLRDSWRITASAPQPISAMQADISLSPDPFQCWVDLSALEESLTVRPRLAGERFDPLGLAGRSQKLSDLMINCRVPRRARRLWPLVCSGPRVIWAAGLRSSHKARITDQSTWCVHLVCKKAV
jgi:tRNA(Ile)-lysidine synthase